MKLIGKLKENVAKAENKEQAKDLIAKAGMELTDEEVDQVSGGAIGNGNGYIYDGRTDNLVKQDNGMYLNPETGEWLGKVVK